MVSLPALASIALMIASGVIAAPWDKTSRHTTHRVRTVGPSNVKLTSYHPPAKFETYGVEGEVHPLAKRGVVDALSVDAAKSFLENKLGIQAKELSYKGGHKSNNVSFEYFRQVLSGIPIANAVANVALKDDKVTSFESIAAAVPKLTKEQAIAKAEQTTGAKYNDWPTSLEYFAKDSDHVVLTHVVQVQNSNTSEWYEIFVDTNSGEIVNVIDFVSDASYRVVPFTAQDPTKGYSLHTDPADAAASPNGWHSTGSTTTSGNNVISYKGIIPIGALGTSSQSSATNNYDYTYNSAVSPTTSPNVDAARVNAFYTGNMIHDYTYKYGFTEDAYNFQNDNYGKGVLWMHVI